jgi:methyl-accepting chemotaxis protein
MEKTMKILHLKTLRARITLPVLACTALLFAGIGTVMIIQGRNNALTSMACKGESLANLLEKISVPCIVNYDYSSLDGFVKEASKDPDVAFILFSDSKGKPLTKGEAPQDRSGLILMEREIKDPETQTILGRLQVGYSLVHMRQTMHKNMLAIVASFLGALVLMVVGLMFITRSLTRILNRFVANLAEGSGQVVAAALQVSSASQSLAAGSSQQAASLEETTASLEELSSTVKQNSLHAEDCNELVILTNAKTKEVHKSIRATKTFMETISTSGESIKKIIKNIDEIAFQTNLLALNAAVEAARAGHAGAGFAVVAEEVRALAMRAGDAAKTTNDLIGETARQIELGSTQIQETLTKFYDMGESAKKVNTLVDEITSASKEQAIQIDHLNQAMQEIDKVVQQNAANAEESASAATELQAQAGGLQEIVAEVSVLVHGQGHEHSGGAAGPGDGRRRHLVAAPAAGGKLGF